MASKTKDIEIHVGNFIACAPKRKQLLRKGVNGRFYVHEIDEDEYKISISTPGRGVPFNAHWINPKKYSVRLLEHTD